MISKPISLSRRHVLGDFYDRCEAIDNVPVYLDDSNGELLGHVDQGLGHYADAFSFHLSDDICKKLAAGYFTYAFEFAYLEPKPKAGGGRRRVTLHSISLISRQNYEKPIPRAAMRAEAGS